MLIKQSPKIAKATESSFVAESWHIAISKNEKPAKSRLDSFRFETVYPHQLHSCTQRTGQGNLSDCPVQRY